MTYHLDQHGQHAPAGPRPAPAARRGIFMRPGYVRRAVGHARSSS